MRLSLYHNAADTIPRAGIGALRPVYSALETDQLIDSC